MINRIDIKNCRTEKIIEIEDNLSNLKFKFLSLNLNIFRKKKYFSTFPSAGRPKNMKVVFPVLDFASNLITITVSF